MASGAGGGGREGRERGGWRAGRRAGERRAGGGRGEGEREIENIYICPLRPGVEREIESE